MVKKFKKSGRLYGPFTQLSNALRFYKGSEVKVELQKGLYNDLVVSVVIEGPSEKEVNDCWDRLRTWSTGLNIKIIFPTDKYANGDKLARAINKDLVKNWEMDYHDKRAKQVRSLTGTFASEGVARQLVKVFGGRIEKR